MLAYEEPGIYLFNTDVLSGLKAMATESVQCVVTSPPYWGLRDYKVDGQLGLEKTPEAYVEKMVAVFREVRRVLRKDGTCWLNLGDSYAGSGKGGNPEGSQWSGFMGNINREKSAKATPSIVPNGLKPKDLVGIPWRVAFALQADGWWLRSDIIWSKPNPMPESVTDRPTKAHEYLFLLTKSARYYYDEEAIKENVTGNAHARGDGVNPKARSWKTADGWDTSKGDGGHGSFHKQGREDGRTGYQHKTRPRQNESFSGAVNALVTSRNRRSVWEIATMPYKEAHFATFPEKLVEPCILAGSKAGDTVLDPFAGSGTVLAVAKRLNRHAVGLELNPDYCILAQNRIKDTPRSLF